jgi:sucrose phosphorylase
MADLIVNHVSIDSPQCQDYLRLGGASPYAGMFLSLDAVFPGGATEAGLTAIYRPRPGLPFTPVQLATGERRLLWTTFTSKQIDIDVHHPAGEAYLDAILEKFRLAGIAAIRLDAAGYAIKKAGTSCFMIPETYAFIAELAAKARAAGIEVLVEIHSHYRHREIPSGMARHFPAKRRDRARYPRWNRRHRCRRFGKRARSVASRSDRSPGRDDS